MNDDVLHTNECGMEVQANRHDVIEENEFTSGKAAVEIQITNPPNSLDVRTLLQLTLASADSNYRGRSSQRRPSRTSRSPDFRIQLQSLDAKPVRIFSSTLSGPKIIPILAQSISRHRSFNNGVSIPVNGHNYLRLCHAPPTQNTSCQPRRT